MDVDYLRISVTDRCNLRCVYCNPLGCCDVTPCEEVLTVEEIKRAVKLLVDCGIRKVRITGGEPLLRGDIIRLIEGLADIAGIEDISLTTNGVFLGSFVSELQAAGLQRVNVSVDSMDRQTYKEITGLDLLPSVADGIHKAIKAGLTPVKINSVIMKGMNDNNEQITALAEMSVHLPIAVRFIEYCQTNMYTEPVGDYVPNRIVRTVIERRYGPLSGDVVVRGNGPAVHFKIKGSLGAIGFISGRSSIFCPSCRRFRLTSDGKLMPCLYSPQSYDLARLIRNDMADEQIRDFLKTIIGEKARFTKLNAFKEDVCMRRIGG